MRSGTNKNLFNSASVLEVLPDQERQIKAKIQSLASDYVLNVSEDDLVSSLADEYRLDPFCRDLLHSHGDSFCFRDGARGTGYGDDVVSTSCAGYEDSGTSYSTPAPTA